ncbi:MAG: hypothetical protein LBT54_02555, partial [Bifidobacteriaceae bacterium]|nr:hypothetical protein [Bifidobacteriaceae bacterium]
MRISRLIRQSNPLPAAEAGAGLSPRARADHLALTGQPLAPGPGAGARERVRPRWAVRLALAGLAGAAAAALAVAGVLPIGGSGTANAAQLTARVLHNTATNSGGVTRGTAQVAFPLPGEAEVSDVDPTSARIVAIGYALGLPAASADQTYQVTVDDSGETVFGMVEGDEDAAPGEGQTATPLTTGDTLRFTRQADGSYKLTDGSLDGLALNVRFFQHDGVDELTVTVPQGNAMVWVTHTNGENTDGE